MTRFAKYNNEKGFALILALSMLAIMSILGAFALMTSTTEVQISGNYSSGQQAFIAADRSIEIIDTRFNPGSNFLNVDTGDIITLDGFYLNRYNRSGLVPGANNIVEITRVDEKGGGFRDVYYMANLTGGFFLSADSNQPIQRTRIETSRVAENRYFGEVGSGVSGSTTNLQTVGE